MYLKIICGLIAIASLINGVLAFDNYRERKERQEVPSRSIDEPAKTQKRIGELEAEVAALKASASKMTSPNSGASPSELKTLSERLEEFQSAVTTNFNALATTTNEHTKLLSKLTKQTTPPIQPPANPEE